METQETIWPLAVYFLGALSVAAAMLFLSWFLGERHRDATTAEPYESGIAATGDARVRMDARFYLVAMFFVIFDLEAVFLFAWAVSARETGWAGYVEMVVFTVVLLVGLAYLWRLGALDWGPTGRKARRAAGTERRIST